MIYVRKGVTCSKETLAVRSQSVRIALPSGMDAPSVVISEAHVKSAIKLIYLAFLVFPLLKSHVQGANIGWLVVSNVSMFPLAYSAGHHECSGPRQKILIF